MHLVVPTHTYFFLGDMPSKQDISPQRSLSWNPKIDFLFLPTARPHPLIPLTYGLPPMYWLGTSRWCLGLVCVDTQFCIHNLIKENDLNDQFMYPKNHNCITCINLFLHYMHHFVFALHALIHSLHIIKMILRF